jgi:predicted MFS family arabinose efflux permease
VYRLWRDLGYAVGALLAGLTADTLGLPAAMAIVAALTAISDVIAAARMSETHQSRSAPDRGSAPSPRQTAWEVS